MRTKVLVRSTISCHGSKAANSSDSEYTWRFYSIMIVLHHQIMYAYHRWILLHYDVLYLNTRVFKGPELPWWCQTLCLLGARHDSVGELSVLMCQQFDGHKNYGEELPQLARSSHYPLCFLFFFPFCEPSRLRTLLLSTHHILQSVSVNDQGLRPLSQTPSGSLTRHLPQHDETASFFLSLCQVTDQ